MGNRTSVATIHVSFDNNAVVSGSTVTGKVYLAIIQDVVSCVSVGSRVVGKESTVVSYTVTVGHGDRRHTERRTAREQRYFMDLKFCLQQNPSGNMYKGQYEYPFQFTIPPGAPATMHAGGDYGGDNCSISYSMEVWLDRPGLLRWDIRNHMIVNVTNPPPVGSKTPLYIEPSRYPLHSMCCFPRGDLLIGGAAESSILTAGGQSFIKYAIENNSTVTVKAIEVSISEHVTFSARGHRGGMGLVRLFHKRLTPNDAGLDLTPRPSQKVGNGDGLETLRILSQMLESDKYKLNINISSDARNSYNGSIIHVIHKLEIRAVTTFGTANPCVWRHIKMYSQDRPGGARAQSENPINLPQLPQDWKPQVAEAVLLPCLALSSAPLAEDDDDDDNKPVAYAVASAHTPDAAYGSFEQFSAAISHTYDPCGELEKYIREGNSVDALTAEQFFTMFKAVNDVFDQQRFADILAAALTSITCVKVARALAGSRDMCKREVAEKLLCAGSILDKAENAHLVKSELTAFQFMTVEKYLTA